MAEELEALTYRHLERGILPKIYPAIRITEALKNSARQASRGLDLLRNEAALIKPLAVRKAVRITGTKFSGYRTSLRNCFIFKPEETAVFQVDYVNQLVRPNVAKISQSIGDVEAKAQVLFLPRSTYTFQASRKVTSPAVLECSANVTSELGIFKYDSVYQRYSVGLFDDRYKPLDEYPVSGVSNAILDIAYSWRVQNTVYPTPLPSGLTIDNLSVEMVSGFISYEGKAYKDPAVNNTVRIRARIVNNTGATIRLTHWGLPVSVLYEDNKHVSQADVSISFPEKTLANGEYYSYSLDLNLPAWAYGRVAVAHAINFYRNGLYFYGGGPFYCFEVFRLRLP